MIRRRALTLLIIVLLIGVPAGYLVISANQSRDSGKDKEAKYSATGLTEGWPSRVQRRLYQVPIPDPSSQVAYYETNNWKTSRLYVQFQTTNAGLEEFLAAVGADRADLTKDDITISARDRGVTGWTYIARRDKPFHQRDAELLARLSAHFRRSLRNHIALEGELLHARAADSIIARLNIGWLTLDATGTVVQTSAHASAILDHSAALKIGKDGRLVAMRSSANGVLQSAIAAISAEGSACATEPPTVPRLRIW